MEALDLEALPLPHPSYNFRAFASASNYLKIILSYKFFIQFASNLHPICIKFGLHAEYKSAYLFTNL